MVGQLPPPLPGLNNNVGAQGLGQGPQGVAPNAAPAQPGPLQFLKPQNAFEKLLGGIANAFRSLVGMAQQQAPVQQTGPHATFQLSRAHLRGDSSTNIGWVKDQVFGDVGDRTNVNQAQLLLDMQGVTALAQRSDLNYQVPLANGGHLSGFTLSADQNNTAFDLTRPVVVFLSGSGGPAEEYGGEIAADYCENHNCNVMAMNYQGYGNSSAIDPTENSITKDGLAMVNHLLQQGFQPDQIILHGYSLGASVTSRLQGIVESSGHELRGVVYDRPMSSATGAAKAEGEALQLPGPLSPMVSNVMAFGTKITSGALSTRKNLEDLVAHSPQNQLRSPTFLVSDTGNFGARSQAMGAQFQNAGMECGQTGQNHFDHTAAIQSLGTLNGFGQIF